MPIYLFGDQPFYELNTRDRHLLVNGSRAPLGSRALDVLVALVERAGDVVSRRELIDQVWPNVAIEENNLNVQVGALRRLLGAPAIVTVPGRGYSFIPRTRLAHERGNALPQPQRERFKTNLPASLPPLIGREEDGAILEQLLTGSRLVTILGAGGMGKTALARHLLRRLEDKFRHGVCFVDLSAVHSAEELPGAITAALGMRPGGGEPLAGLAYALAPTEILVVLDGAEHLIEAVADAAKVMHEAAPGVRLVVTSQIPLRLAAESLHRLGPLAVPEGTATAFEAIAYGAIALFVLRAQAADSRYELTDEAAPLTIQVCRALEGLPLALELAASRVPMLGIEQLATSMHEPLRLLSAPTRDVPKRLQTLRNALEWSHDLLSSNEQVVLRRMAVLVGSSDLPLIQDVVCDPPGDGPIDTWVALDALSALVERSLVAAVPGWDGNMSYRLLDTPRAFAHECLSAAGECESLSRRHALAVAARFERAHAERYSEDVAVEAWQTRQLLDLDNGRAALAWAVRHGEQGTALVLLPGLICSTAMEERGKISELIKLSAALVQGQQARPEAMWAMVEGAHISAGFDPASSRKLADTAVTIARQCAALEDRRGLYCALCVRALTLLMEAQTEAGASSLAEARALEQAQWPSAVRAYRWRAEVWLADRRDDGPGMYESSLRLVQLLREAGYPQWGLGLILVNGAMAVQRTEEAVTYGLEVVAQFEGTRHFTRLTETRIQLIGALIECGRLEEARAQSHEAWPYASQFGRLDVLADYHALLIALEGRLRDAARLVGFANEFYKRTQVVRTHNELAATNRTLSILRTSLDETELKFLFAQGAGLPEPEVAAIATRVTPGPP